MIKILTIVGARPQIIKAAAISRAIKNHYTTKIQEVIIHTGQHYDPNLSKIFFDELLIPKEDYNLNIGSGSHALQTASIMTKLEDVLVRENPKCILLYGDTNSTLAAAIVSSKIGIPIIHVEAGVRSYKKHYPEEINRLVCDHLSTLLFVPTITGCENLYKEGFKKNNKLPYTSDNPHVFFCGDIMYDNSLYFLEIARKESTIIERLNLKNEKFLLATIHRPHNTDNIDNLFSIFSAFDNITNSGNIDIVIPLHPRTSAVLAQGNALGVFEIIKNNSHIRIIPPASYLEMINLEFNAEIIFTDSGGVQKEAYFYEKPSVLLLEETPWVELVESGNAFIAGSDTDKIVAGYDLFKDRKDLLFKKLYGNGDAAQFICEKIIENFN